MVRFVTNVSMVERSASTTSTTNNPKDVIANTTTPKNNNNNASTAVAASPWREQSTIPTRPEGFSPFVAFCFTVNTIMGTGFLTVPWAFVQGGLVLSTIVIIFVGIFSDMAKNYVLEAMARAEKMLDQHMHWLPNTDGDEEKGRLFYAPIQEHAKNVDADTDHDVLMKDKETIKLFSVTATFPLKHYATMNSAADDDDDDEEIRQDNDNTNINDSSEIRRRIVHKKPEKYIVRHRKFEVNTLCRIFLGKTGLRVYTFFVSVYVYCALW